MLLISVFVFITVSVLYLVICEILRIRRLYRKTADIPGPLNYPLIGSGYIFLGSNTYLFNNFLELMKFYGSPTRISFGPRMWVFIKNPEQIKTVLRNNNTVEKDNIYHILKLGLGKGLVTSEHKIWRVHRKILQPTLSTQIVKSFMSIFQKNALLLTEAVETNIECQEFELSPYILKTNFLNTLESVLGLSLESESSNNVDNYLNNINRLMVLAFERIKKVWLHAHITFLISPMGMTAMKCLKHINNYTDNLIEKKRKHMQNTSVDYYEDTSVKKVKPTLEFMIQLADNESKFSKDELREHALTFITGSYDTSTRALGFIFLMLASHPDVQNRVYEEIFNIYGDDNVECNPVQYEDLQKLIYLERVIKETLRLFPSLPLIGREATEDFDLDGYLIPKHCGIVVNIFALHRDEKIWPNPLKFDPDRFLPDAINQQHPCDYIPFSYGSRNCIGRVYGMMSMKIIIVTFLRKYIVKKDNILPVEDIKVQMDILLQSTDPIKVRIEKREKFVNKEICQTYL